MDIIIRVVSTGTHRPGITGADWFFDANGDLQVRVTKLSDWRMEVALGLHEAFEAALCKHTGVTVAMVDEFDGKYEQSTPENQENHGIFAGDHPECPYAYEHSLATAAERIFTAATGVCWSKYDQEVGDAG